MKIVIDHVRGSRRGQRQEFAAGDRLSIGRHPRSDVSFDANRDLDASSRHAEVRRVGEAWVLCDVGSSNGTFVDGRRVGEIAVELEHAVDVEFGGGGPILRIWIGPPDRAPEPRSVATRLLASRRVIAAGLVVVVVAAVALMLFR